MQPLAGRVAIVTGASRGIGKGCAIELGAAGATVYVTGRTLREGDAALPGSDRVAPRARSDEARRARHRRRLRPPRRRGRSRRSSSASSASRAASTCS